MDANFKIGNTWVGAKHPVYFIAEIGANHDGNIDRAIELIKLAKESGANAVKFQHYSADTLASAAGFRELSSLGHYSSNPHSIFSKYETPWEWTPQLKLACDQFGIEFMSTPYSLEAADHLAPYVNAFKIGSGDITYSKLLKHVKSIGKPVIISTGASHALEVKRAAEESLASCVMQCNTNYTNDRSNLRYLNLAFIGKLKEAGYLPGFSYHLTELDPIIAAVAMGAKMIEVHFSDKKSTSPDNPFAMSPFGFEFMVEIVRDLEEMMGSGEKVVEPNERETVVLQRRCLRAARPMQAGEVVTEADVVALRPAPVDSIPPYEMRAIIGRPLVIDVEKGQAFDWLDVEIEIDFKDGIRGKYAGR